MSKEKTSKSPGSSSRAKEVSKETRDEIIDLKKKGYGTRRIVPRVGLSRKVVRRILTEEGLLEAAGQQPEQSKLAPFKDAIEEKVEVGLTSSRIFREVKELGYQGKRTILADLARSIRARKAPQPNKKVKRRFETRPGREMQIDWSPYWVPIAGVVVLVHALGCLLCASRKLFLYFFRDERQSTLLEGLAMAFEYFDGCALRLVLDNMSTAVLARYGAADGQPIWHDRFLDFARHYGFGAFACHVRDPDRKGKKEKSFRLVWDDFLKASEFDSWQDLNARARIWLDHTPEAANCRVHGTTGRVPNEAWLAEKDLLIQLPHKRFPVYQQDVRPVDNDSTIAVRGRRYTVPSVLAGTAVSVHLFAEHFEVLDRYGRLALSRTYASEDDERKLIIDKTHYETLPRRPRLPGGSQRLDQAFIDRYPSLAPLASGLQVKMKSLAPVHFRALLRLADRYDHDDFVAAATKAQDFKRFDANAVERILERDHGPGEHDTTPLIGGLGPLIIGDVDQGDLDAYAHLDSLNDQGEQPEELEPAKQPDKEREEA
jgi:transposase